MNSLKLRESGYLDWFLQMQICSLLPKRKRVFAIKGVELIRVNIQFRLTEKIVMFDERLNIKYKSVRDQHAL